MSEPTRRFRIHNLELGLAESELLLRSRAAEAAGVPDEALGDLKIVSKSIDARKHRGVRRLRFVVHVETGISTAVGSEEFKRALRSGRVREARPPQPLRLEGCGGYRGRAVVVGTGPAGLYAAWTLALNGAQVDVIDRGAALKDRGRDLVRFRRTRVPDPESNLLYGEGGAGTYSDGKLYTRVDDPLEISCLQELVDCGAPEEILFDSRAHIGTDKLHRILPEMRRRMEAEGVRFHWGVRLEKLALGPGGRRVRGAITSAGELPCDALFLAPGHSARDTIRALHDQGVAVEAKPFQLGVRVEHPQELITAGRYGRGPEAEMLGPAYYNLVSKPGSDGPACHSFCMCPGGKIVASVNIPGALCTNGMSNSRHSSPWANAALVTTFGPAEFGDGPFDGVAFQEELERRFFEAGGADYTAPGQRADDFLAGRETKNPRHSSFSFGTCPGRIDRLLPQSATAAIARGLRRFDRVIPGFAGPEGLLVGLESRSSGPIRLPRDRDSGIAAGFENLYPMGEGAGFAGGIMSAAIDGARAAQRLLQLRDS
ncbi:hypothetical protein ABI59_20440 [Acidobacteria bacterium Mor1]|nr:hypothetical protein ABI59_20440 [Acidobacteria bacterium Mor1]